MKLNLLPQAVTKRSTAPVFIALAVLIILLASALSAYMVISSKKALDDSVANREQYLKPYADNLATANSAEEVIQQAVNYDRNVKFVEAAAKHNNVYPDLYTSLFPYIPSFYRIQSITAAGAGDQCTVTLVGHLRSFQQYADLEIALWRIPDVLSVQRAGFAPRLSQVQPLDPTRQKSISIMPGETPIPDDAQAAIEILKARAAAEPQGFINAGGFGTDTVPKGDMPTSQTVTMTLLLKRNLEVPVPAATLQAAAAAPAPGAAAPAAPAPGPPAGAPGRPGDAGGDR